MFQKVRDFFFWLYWVKIRKKFVWRVRWHSGLILNYKAIERWQK